MGQEGIIKVMNAFHICLNMLGGSNWLGGTTYIRNLAKAISMLPSDERNKITISAVASASNRANIGSIRDTVDNVFISGLGRRVALEILNHLPNRMFDLVRHSLNTQDIDFFYPETVGMRLPYNFGSWIPDFQHRYMPELFSREEIDIRNKMYSRIASNAPIIILSSKMALNDFNEFYPHAARRSTILNFCSYVDEKWFDADTEIVQKKYNLPDNYFIVCNQFWKHKGHDVLIKALKLLREHRIEAHIVCTGHTADVRFPEYFRELEADIRKSGLEKMIIILGLIPRFDQIQLIRRSLAVIQPSLFEGWSTVVEDARSLGKEILLSNFPVHIEQDPPNATFFTQGDPTHLYQVMHDALHNLNRGPDKEREEAAIIGNRRRLFDFGKRFVEIAYSVT